MATEASEGSGKTQLRAMTQKMSDLGLKNNELFAITEVFKSNPLIFGASVFGSRAKGVYAPYSDVDIAIYGDLSISDVEGVICDLDELPFVYKFDVVAYNLVKNTALRHHIDRVGVKIYCFDYYKPS